MVRVCAAVLLLAAACGKGAVDPPAAEAKPAAAAPAAPDAPVPHPDPSLPMSKRIQGKWRMDISKVPDSALTEEFRKLKQRGKADTLSIVYTVTDTRFSLDARSGRNVWRNSFDYEILREQGDAMLLKRIDEYGQSSEVGVVLKDDDQLILGAGRGAVPMERIAPPEQAR